MTLLFVKVIFYIYKILLKFEILYVIMLCKIIIIKEMAVCVKVT